MTAEELNEVASQEPPSSNRWQFILRQKTSKKHSLDEVTHKSMKKPKKSSPLLNIFKRTGREDKGNNSSTTPTGKLYCLPLATVWQDDDTPPKSIAKFLTILYREGPNCIGILRKTANVKFCKEVRLKVDQGEHVEEEITAPVAGYLIKDYLRSLPDPLLTETLHKEWVEVANITEEEQKVIHIKHLLSQMPAPNVSMLKHVLCALHQIQLQAEENQMNSSNLSLCIAPSLLWHRESIDVSGAAPAVAFMIDHCVELFGPQVLQLLQEPHAKSSRPDSSGTDSDSYHSVLSIPETGNSDSIDSLVDRELFTGDGEGDEDQEGRTGGPPVTKSHLSPSNLSRDSGLTLSDSQLYDEDCTDHHHQIDSRGMVFHTGHHPHHIHPLLFGEREDEESDVYPRQGHPPVPPPRIKSRRHGAGSVRETGHTGHLDSGGGGIRVRDKRHTLHGSLSSSQLLDLPGEDSASPASSTTTLDSLRTTRTLPAFTNVAEAYSQMERDELREYSRSSDIGLLRKSASGAHLFLDEEMLSRKCLESNLVGSGGFGGGVVFRQSSGMDSTPPHSPQSKHSFSSHDSVISESSQGGRGVVISRESSITSAPQTPDTDYSDRRPPWLPTLDLDYDDSESRQAYSLNIGCTIGGVKQEDEEEEEEQEEEEEEEEAPLNASCGAAMMLPMTTEAEDVVPEEPPMSELSNSEVEDQDFMPLSFTASRVDHQSLQAPTPSLPWQHEHRSREAEDIPSLSLSPQHRLSACSKSMDNLEDPEADEATPRASPNSSSADMLPLAIAHGHGGLPLKQMSRYSHHLAKVSPPPRVLLQSLRSSRSGRDPAPLRASHHSNIVAQVQKAGFSTPWEVVREDRSEDNLDIEKYHRTESKGMSGGERGAEGGPGLSGQGFDAAKSMEDALNDTEYVQVQPRLTIIRREESLLSNASSSSMSSASSSGITSSLSSLTTSPSTCSTPSSGSSSHTLSGEQQTRPSRPPKYEEAVQRSLMLKQQEMPLDVEAEAQVEVSHKSRHLLESSKQQYLQDRQEQTELMLRTRKISDPGTSRISVPVLGGCAREETDLPRSVSPECAWRIAENFNMGMQGQRVSGKDPRLIYLESVQRYEQQQLSMHLEGSGARTTETASTKVVSELDSKSKQDSAFSAAESSKAKFLTRKVSDTTVYELRSGSELRNSSRPTVPTSDEPSKAQFSTSKITDMALYEQKSGSDLNNSSCPTVTTSNVERTQTRTVQVSATQVQVRSSANKTYGPKYVRPRSMLDIPFSSSLHRSFSDSADRLNKLGLQSPPCQSGEASVRKDSEDRRPPGIAFFAAESTRAQTPVRKISDAVVYYKHRSESEFSNPPCSSVLPASSSYHEDDSTHGGRCSPSYSQHVPSLPPRSQSSQLDSSLSTRVSRTEDVAGSSAGRGGARPPRSESPACRTPKGVPSVGQGSVSSITTSADHSSPCVAAQEIPGASAAADSRPKSRLGWSVKSLAKIYATDASEQSPQNHPFRSGQASAGARGPPPYQDPPPFRRLQDSSHLSSSSNSSSMSSDTARSSSPTVSRKEGQQNVEFHGETDLGHQSTRWARGRSANGIGTGDQEAINPSTDMSYI